MNQAQAARQTSEDQQAANVNPEQRRREPDREAAAEEPEHGEDAELEGYSDDEEDIERQTVEILSRVRRRIREQPLTAAGGAFILGFAIGNGVPKFLARAGIAVGLRIVMQRMFDRADLFESEA